MPREASFPPINIIDHHRDKTRRHLTGKPYPLGRQLCTICWCRGEASPSTSSLHEGRHSRQVKTSRSKLSRNQPEHPPPTVVEGPGNNKREPGRLQNRLDHRGSLQPTSTNRPSQVWTHWSCKSLYGYRNK
jgi:hypothetical protein